MRSPFHRPLADLGTFLAVAAIGYLVVATTAGRLTRRWGASSCSRWSSTPAPRDLARAA
jgi:hypothetical protein